MRASVSYESDPGAIVASIIDSTAGHPARIYDFPGLERQNCQFSLDEINGSGDPIRNIALFDVVPGTLEGLLCRPNEQIRTDITPGFTSGSNSFVFDGTGGKPDYRGWELTISQIAGTNFLVKTEEFDWDKETGTGTLLNAGDIFNGAYQVIFDQQQQTAGGSVSNNQDFGILFKTSDYNIDVTDFSKKIIAEPDGNYMELLLPPIATVPQGRRIMVEVGGTHMATVKMTPRDGEIINFFRGNLYGITGESFAIYKFIRDIETENYEWRVDQEYGNFKTVGQKVTTYFPSVVGYNVQNTQRYNGDLLDKNQCARLYNDFLELLPLDCVCDFDDWATGTNKYLWSYANSSNPANVNLFHCPDLRDIFEKATGDDNAGTYMPEEVGSHTHPISTIKANSYTGGPNNPTQFGNGGVNPQTFIINTSSNIGTKNVPNNYSINTFFFL